MGNTVKMLHIKTVGVVRPQTAAHEKAAIRYLTVHTHPVLFTSLLGTAIAKLLEANPLLAYRQAILHQQDKDRLQMDYLFQRLGLTTFCVSFCIAHFTKGQLLAPDWLVASGRLNISRTFSPSCSKKYYTPFGINFFMLLQLLLNLACLILQGFLLNLLFIYFSSRTFSLILVFILHHEKNSFTRVT